MGRDLVTATGGYAESDPIGLAGAGVGSFSTFPYAGSNPLSYADPSGLDTYITNRDLAAFGNSARPRNDSITHTFVFTTNPNGSITHTYSWGNDANLHGWNIDQPIDLKTANEAIKRGYAQHVGGPDLDPFVAKAYDDLNESVFEHGNGIITSNCKTEAGKLLIRAYKLEGDYYKAFLIRPEVKNVR